MKWSAESENLFISLDLSWGSGFCFFFSSFFAKSRDSRDLLPLLFSASYCRYAKGQMTLKWDPKAALLQRGRRRVSLSCNLGGRREEIKSRNTYARGGTLFCVRVGEKCKEPKNLSSHGLVEWRESFSHFSDPLSGGFLKRIYGLLIKISHGLVRRRV